jgi:hypothetical protein
MKIEFPEEIQILVKNSLIELGLPDTIETRQFVCTLGLNYGLVILAMSQGTLTAFKKETGIDPLVEQSTEQSEPSLVDGLCPDCKVPIVKLGDGRNVCNCRVWNKR